MVSLARLVVREIVELRAVKEEREKRVIPDKLEGREIRDQQELVDLQVGVVCN